MANSKASEEAKIARIFPAIKNLLHFSSMDLFMIDLPPVVADLFLSECEVESFG